MDRLIFATVEHRVRLFRSDFWDPASLNHVRSICPDSPLRSPREPLRHLVDGRETGGAQRTGSVFDPATGAVQRQVAFVTASEVQLAIAAAKAALPGWRAKGLVKRADVFFRLRQQLK